MKLVYTVFIITKTIIIGIITYNCNYGIQILSYGHGIICERSSIAHGRFSQIAEGYVEFMKLNMWKPISSMVSAKNNNFKPHLAFYHTLMLLYHAK